MKTFIRLSALVLLPLIFASGCKLVQVAFPDGADRASFVKYTVHGKNDLSQSAGKLAIGDYSVKVSRGWTSSKSTSGSVLFRSDTETDINQKYSYAISGPDGFAWSGECQAYAKVEKESSKLVTKVNTSSTQVLENTLVGVFSSADKKQYEMKLQETAQKAGADKKGSIKGKDVTLEVVSTSKIAESDIHSFRVTGYYIYEKGALAAVVEMVNLGAVYISKTASKESFPAILNTAAALLAYQDPARTE
jgi:hypothetical protein